MRIEFLFRYRDTREGIEDWAAFGEAYWCPEPFHWYIPGDHRYHPSAGGYEVPGVYLTCRRNRPIWLGEAIIRENAMVLAKAAAPTWIEPAQDDLSIIRELVGRIRQR
jgi:hypothetical protein